MSDNISIAFCVDDKFAMPLTVASMSLLLNCKSTQHIDFHIIHTHFDVRSRNIFESSLSTLVDKQYSLYWYPISADRIGDVHTTEHVSAAAYLKLLIPEVVPKSVDKIIYLDADLIVLADIANLWATPMNGKPLLAVDHINLSKHYLNSGVFLMNVKKWRAESLSTQALRFAKENKELCVWYDQDVFNHLFAGEWGELDPRWNQLPGALFNVWEQDVNLYPEYDKLVHNPFIVDFAKPQYKPWLFPDNPHPFTSTFWDYHSKTLWTRELNSISN